MTLVVFCSSPFAAPTLSLFHRKSTFRAQTSHAARGLIATQSEGCTPCNDSLHVASNKLFDDAIEVSNLQQILCHIHHRHEEGPLGHYVHLPDDAVGG